MTQDRYMIAEIKSSLTGKGGTKVVKRILDSHLRGANINYAVSIVSDICF